MKGFCTYLSVMILFIVLHVSHVSCQSSNGTNAVVKEKGSSGGNSTSDSFNVLDNMGFADPSIRDYLTMVYGSLMGRPECIKKSVCFAGDYLRGTPGVEFVFTMADRYVPDSIRTLFNVLRDSIQNGTDCQVYICTAATPGGPR